MPPLTGSSGLVLSADLGLLWAERHTDGYDQDGYAEDCVSDDQDVLDSVKVRRRAGCVVNGTHQAAC